MKCEIITVETKERTNAQLYTYFLDNYQEIDSTRTRPVVIICPGGGYRITSDREGEAVAVQFAARGYHACVLKYSIAPAEFPQALCELAWCVDYLRSHAEEIGIKKERIFVTGFSAGGHLAASLGVYWQEPWLAGETGLSGEAIRPDGLILCYPVITSGKFGHSGSFENLMGTKATPQLKEYLSLENQVTEKMPPVFIWHTWEDQSVPVENTLLMIGSLRRAGVMVEAHIFPRGQHGLALANRETMDGKSGLGIEQHCQSWISLAGEWIHDLMQEE